MKTLQELTAIKEEMRKEMALRLGQEADAAKYRKHILMCGGTGCTSSGSREIKEHLEKEIEAQGLADSAANVLAEPVLCAYGTGTLVVKKEYQRPEFADPKFQVR